MLHTQVVAEDIVETIQHMEIIELAVAVAEEDQAQQEPQTLAVAVAEMVLMVVQES
jgi:hypothetical protein